MDISLCGFSHVLANMYVCFHSQISMSLTMNRILFVLINLIVFNCVAIQCANDFSRNFGLSRGKRSTDSILDTGQLVRYKYF